MYDDTLYIKVGKKYKKIGTQMNTDYMHDGLWLFQSHDHSKERNNLSLRLSDLPSQSDVQKFMKAFLNKEVIIKAIQNLETKKGLKFYNSSMSDMAEEITNELYLNSIKKDKK